MSSPDRTRLFGTGIVRSGRRAGVNTLMSGHPGRWPAGLGDEFRRYVGAPTIRQRCRLSRRQHTPLERETSCESVVLSTQRPSAPSWPSPGWPRQLKPVGVTAGNQLRANAGGPAPSGTPARPTTPRGRTSAASCRRGEVHRLPVSLRGQVAVTPGSADEPIKPSGYESSLGSHISRASSCQALPTRATG